MRPLAQFERINGPPPRRAGRSFNSSFEASRTRAGMRTLDDLALSGDRRCRKSSPSAECSGSRRCLYRYRVRHRVRAVTPSASTLTYRAIRVRHTLQPSVNCPSGSIRGEPRAWITWHGRTILAFELASASAPAWHRHAKSRSRIFCIHHGTGEPIGRPVGGLTAVGAVHSEAESASAFVPVERGIAVEMTTPNRITAATKMIDAESQLIGSVQVSVGSPAPVDCARARFRHGYVTILRNAAWAVLRFGWHSCGSKRDESANQ